MKVAVTSTVVLDVPGAHDLESLKRALYASNVIAIGRQWQTTSGVYYSMDKIERFDVEARP